MTLQEKEHHQDGSNGAQRQTIKAKVHHNNNEVPGFRGEEKNQQHNLFQHIIAPGISMTASHLQNNPAK